MNIVNVLPSDNRVISNCCDYVNVSSEIDCKYRLKAVYIQVKIVVLIYMYMVLALLGGS